MSFIVHGKSLPVDSLVPAKHNPNKMSTRKFNLLVDNLSKGFTDPIYVRPVEDGKYRIIGGHHRWEAAKVLGLEEVPVTINTDPEFDEDQEAFQLMRHNMIRGNLDAQSFVKLYESLTQKYGIDVLADAFGFEEEEELQKLIKKTEKTLPKEMKEKFKEAAKDVKTLADLSQLLNKLFSTYGDTLPYGYMFMDFGGKESVWVRMMPKDMKLIEKIGVMCFDKKRSLDSMIRAALQLIANGSMPPDFDKLVMSSPEVEIKTPSATSEEELAKLLS